MVQRGIMVQRSDSIDKNFRPFMHVDFLVE